ncbi:MAG: hypothetical protein ONB55_21785 [candidate division KSB1 bacterium]|nr:hypothetical protein [candidate division KSB1 bacterium]
MIDIELLKRMEPLLNLSALERLAGITRGKLSKKIKVGSKYGEPLPPRPEGDEIKIAASSDSLEIIGEVSIQEKVMRREAAIEKLKAAARQMGGGYLVNIEHDPENSNPLIDIEWRAKVGVRK